MVCSVVWFRLFILSGGIAVGSNFIVEFNANNHLYQHEA